jgi:type II secretory pathway component PulF
MSPLFRYQIKDTNGIDGNGEIEALDVDDAVKKLQEQGLVVISINIVKPIEQAIAYFQKEKTKNKKGRDAQAWGILLLILAVPIAIFLPTEAGVIAYSVLAVTGLVILIIGLIR